MKTERLELRAWGPADLNDLVGLNSEPEVYELLGGPSLVAGSASALSRYTCHFSREGWGIWRIEDHLGHCVGLAGLQHVRPVLPVAPAVEAVWRLKRSAWGLGYASEAMKAILETLPLRFESNEVVALIAHRNLRSAKTAVRTGFELDRAADFLYPDESLAPALRPHQVFRYSLNSQRPDLCQPT